MTANEAVAPSEVRTIREDQLRAFTAQVSDYHYRSFPREAFLLALCGGGMRVKDVLQLSFSEVSAETGEEPSHRVRHVARVFDTLCKHSGVSFGLLRSGYVQWAHARSPGITARTPAFFSRNYDRSLTRRSVERSVAEAARRLALREWLTLHEARALSKDITPRADLPSNILAFGDEADWLLRRSFPRQVDFDDAKQELLLRLRKWELSGRREADRFSMKEFVIEVARGIKNEMVSPRRSPPIVLLPHYNWIAAPNDELDSTCQVGLNEIHATRFRRFQMRFLESFSGLEKQVVALLFGLVYCRPHGSWEVASILNIPASAVVEIERKAQQRATTMSRRTRLLLPQNPRSRKRSLAWERERGCQGDGQKLTARPVPSDLRSIRRDLRALLDSASSSDREPADRELGRDPMANREREQRCPER